MKLQRLFRPLLLALGLATLSTPKASAQRAETVIDAQTGKILYERHGTRKLYPASTTKIMTAYLTFEALRDGKLKRNQKLPVSFHAASQEATNLFMTRLVPVKKTIHLKNGHKKTITVKRRKQTVFQITTDQALQGLLVQSGNDAAVVLSEAIGGREENFIKMMNKKAKELGMKNTLFTNPNGLNSKTQVTTAEDMAILFRAVIDSFPKEYHYFGQTYFKFNGHTFPNHNKMLEDFAGVTGKTPYPGMDGGKTGYLRAAGCNLVASAKHGDTRIIGVVLGASSGAARTRDMEALLDKGFNDMAAKDTALRDQETAAAAFFPQVFMPATIPLPQPLPQKPMALPQVYKARMLRPRDRTRFPSRTS